MTTLASDLVTLVRSNLNEPASTVSPLRTDLEIVAWLDAAVMDYLHKVPTEHFPEMILHQTFSGASVALPSGYLFFHSLTVNHTISGSTTEVADAWVVNPGHNYLPLHFPVGMGAWCQITGSTITSGPNTIGGTLSYVKAPTRMGGTTTVTFDLGREHETPIVNFATALALKKVNDADAETYLSLYADAIAAKGGRKESGDIERA